MGVPAIPEGVREGRGKRSRKRQMTELHFLLVYMGVWASCECVGHGERRKEAGVFT